MAEQVVHVGPRACPDGHPCTWHAHGAQRRSKPVRGATETRSYRASSPCCWQAMDSLSDVVSMMSDSDSLVRLTTCCSSATALYKLQWRCLSCATCVLGVCTGYLADFTAGSRAPAVHHTCIELGSSRTRLDSENIMKGHTSIMSMQAASVFGSCASKFDPRASRINANSIRNALMPCACIVDQWTSSVLVEPGLIQRTS